MAIRAEPSSCNWVIGALAEITGHLIICAHETRIGSVAKKRWKKASLPVGRLSCCDEYLKGRFSQQAL